MHDESGEKILINREFRMATGRWVYNFPAGSIRAEELINYFKYDYDAPKNGDRFGVNATVSECPWNKNNMLMILGVNTKDLKEKNKPDSNIVFKQSLQCVQSHPKRDSIFTETRPN